MLRDDLVILAHQHGLKRCQQILGNHADAEDALQMAIGRVLAYHGYIDPARSEPWLFAVIRNSCYELRRARRRQRQHEIHGLPLSEMTSSMGHSHLEQLCLQESTAQVHRAVNRLRSPYRNVFLAVVVCEQSYQECSLQQQIPVGTVKSRLHKARLKLRKALAKGCGL